MKTSRGIIVLASLFLDGLLSLFVPVQREVAGRLGAGPFFLHGIKSEST
jgi:hypothetical protein